MACHEIAALRLGLMNLLGSASEAERSHELAELGTALETPGPLRALSTARDLAQLRTFYQAALSELEERVAQTPATDPSSPYRRSLLVLTKKVELELERQCQNLAALNQELEAMHDFVHEIYPGGD